MTKRSSGARPNRGLAKEGGHASHYGELAVLRAAMCAEELGTEKARQRTIQIIRARTIMSRRPINDGAGYAALGAEESYTFRGRSFPGPLRYVKHGVALTSAAILQDPTSLRLAELYLKHGHFADDARQGRVVRRVEHYLTVRKLLSERDPEPLPLEPSHASFAWADEDLGVFAIKHGDRLVHGSAVFNMPGAVVPVARLHYTTPRLDRLADVYTNIRVPKTEYNRSFADKGGGIPAHLTFPGTPAPPGLDAVDQWRGQDIRASMAYFYQFQFGPYLIGMNTTEPGTYRENTYQLQVPDDVNATRATDLISGKTYDLTSSVRVPPDTTVILHTGSK